MTLWSAPTCWIGVVHLTACFFCFGDFLHPASGIFTQQFLGNHRTWRDPWGLGLRSQTVVLWVFFVTPSVGRTLPTRGSCLLLGIVPRQKTGTYQGTWPCSQFGRLNIGSWCRRVCTALCRGTSSIAEFHWGGKSGRWGPSSQTHILHFSPSSSLEPSILTLLGILRWPGSALSQTFRVLWINPGPWWSCGEWWQTWGGPL